MTITQPRTRTPREALVVGGIVPTDPGIIICEANEVLAQYRYVTLVDGGTESEAAYPAAAGDPVHGITLAAAASGAQVPVMSLNGGMCRIASSGTITAPNQLSSDTSGKARVALAGDHVAGTLLEDAVLDEEKLSLFNGGQLGAVGGQRVVTLAPASAGANVCEVTITIVDENGTTVTGVQQFLLWLSDAATGATLTTTAASGTVTNKAASGDDLGAITAKKAMIAQTLASGVFILEITDTAKTGFYVAAQVMGERGTTISAQLVTGDYG